MPYRTIADKRPEPPMSSQDAGSDSAERTSREDLGTALAAIARLYTAAESRGDRARAERYSSAVDLLLGAWPPCRQLDSERCPPPVRPASTWPTHEETLVGLGIVE
jgi:hypothetical protein